MSKNILYLCSGRNFRSKKPGRKVEGVVSCWRSLGYNVEHVCGADIIKTNRDSSVINYGAQTHHNKWYRKNSLAKILTNSISEYKDIKHDAKIFDYIENISSKNKPFLVWERSSRLHKAGLDHAKKLSVPFVLEWKDNLLSYSSSLLKRKALFVENYKNYESDYIVVESEVLKNELSKEGIDSSKIFVALNAINPEDFVVNKSARVAVREKYKLNDDQVLVGYLGSYAFYHDAKRLVLATEILSKILPISFKVLMVGNGKEYHEVRKLALDLGLLNSFIYMHDAVDKDQVSNVLSGLDVAVLPGSTDIICPIKVQEYMSMGLPSVIPDYLCNREIINTGIDGLLFEPHNEKSLAESLQYLIDNDEKRKQIGKSAKTKALNKFTWEKTWGKVLQEIEKDIIEKV